MSKAPGIVETKYFDLKEPVRLDIGDYFHPIRLAYETYGELNAAKSNAILILHALSGDQHAAGFYEGDDKPGWWDMLIGPGKAFDTDKYFVISSNILGGCKGSTGPSSLDPATQKPYALSFPVISIKDMVDCQKHLIDHFGIERLLCVAGGSMGGMQVLEWFHSYPDRIHSAIPIATTIKHSPQQIAFNEAARQAIMSDISWNDGDYYGNVFPSRGLSVARMIGHITYMSDVSMMEKFGRQKKGDAPAFKFSADFEVENYLRYKGDKFVKRFDANSFLYITKAIDNFDLLRDKPINKVFHKSRARVLVIAFKSDWLYPSYQSKEIVRACKLSGVKASYCEIDSTYGHDAFLLEEKEEAHLIGHFLRNVYNKIGS
ncbi:MAG: homoserine O-acetyltransferase [Candidatus Omnitrophota bacterium]